MKTTALVLAFIVASQLSSAQLKSTPYCSVFIVDVLDGSVNKLYPESPWEDIKNNLPCFSEAVAEPSTSGCAGIFFKDKGIYFYTYRDYIEISENFKGSFTIPLMGADRNSLFKWFGHAQMKDKDWSAYQMRHGLIVVYFDSTGKVNKIILSSKSTETLRVCE